MFKNKRMKRWSTTIPFLYERKSLCINYFINQLISLTFDPPFSWISFWPSMYDIVPGQIASWTEFFPLATLPSKLQHQCERRAWCAPTCIDLLPSWWCRNKWPPRSLHRVQPSWQMKPVLCTWNVFDVRLSLILPFLSSTGLPTDNISSWVYQSDNDILLHHIVWKYFN